MLGEKVKAAILNTYAEKDFFSHFLNNKIFVISSKSLTN